MGEIADDMMDDVIRQTVDFHQEVNELMREKTCKELIDLSAKSREGIIIGIREYWAERKTLSYKQKMVLAKYIANQY